jgi:alpha-ketoglutarate-dependent 2,4-dichlorophenoxyacetate dioxygenase
MGAIEGRTIPVARMFLRDLAEHATQREFVHAHEWRKGDLGCGTTARRCTAPAVSMTATEAAMSAVRCWAGDVSTIEQAG